MSELPELPETSESSQPAPDAETADERFKQITSLLIATATVLAALVTWLQTNASAMSATANRDAQRYATQAMGLKIGGQTQVSYDRQGAFQTWSELNDLALFADTARDEPAAARYRRVRDRIAELSPLLSPDYFDPDVSSRPDLARYEAEVYVVQATQLSERYADAAARYAAWGDKANLHIVHLTLLAVSLTLLGLSSTLSSGVRKLFVVAGLIVAVVTTAWAIGVAVTPIRRLPDQAMEAYARGVGLAYQFEAEQAREAFDEALAAAPDYANAFYERANANYSLGEYPAAIADYQATIAAGRDDANVGWNLGWTHYLLGQFADAKRVNERVLQMDPGLIGVRLNQGLTRLANGENAAAKADYEEAMRMAARIVADARAAGQAPPASLWFYLDAGSLDLQNLVDRLNDQIYDWTEAPPPTAIADPDAVRRIAQDMIRELKSLTAALEYTDRPPESELSATLSEFEFAREVEDDLGNFVQYDKAAAFHYRTKKVQVLFDYEGMQAGQKVLYKVYRNGSEYASLRLVEDWPEELGESGEAQKPLSYAYSRLFILPSGHYDVEMYVDYRLAQRGSFSVHPSDAQVSGPAGSALFRDGFGDPSFASWARYADEDSTRENLDGDYRIYVASPDLTVFSTPGLNFGDAQVEVDTERAGGPDDGEAGLICRYQDSDNFYVLKATNQGFASIFKLANDAWTQLTEWQETDAIEIGDGAVNHLRAECVGSRLALYVNDRLVAEAQDADLAWGDVGLLVGTYDDGGADTRFDDFVVFQPDAAGSLLYQDDFSDPASGWADYVDVDYTTGYADGAYRIHVLASNYSVWSHPGLDFADAQIEVDVARAGGPADAEFGIICRYQDGDNYYVLKASGDGYYAIAKRQGSEWISLVDWETSDAILQGDGAVNRLRADCAGDTLALYVNDQLLAEAHAPRADFASGDVGLLAGTFDETGADVLFDNLAIRQPEGGTLLIPDSRILFQDDFSDPSSGWPSSHDPSANTITDYVSDGYEIYVGLDNYTVWATPGLDEADVSVEVSATKTAGPDDNTFGVICRYQDADNFYVLQISSDGYASISKRQAGEWRLLGADEWLYSEAIVQGESANALRADCVGDTLVLYVNGELLVEAQDTEFVSGDVGLLAGTFDTPGVDILFDDFIVRQP